MFHMHVSYRSRDGGRSCESARQYIAREGRFRKRGDTVRMVVSINMPDWAGDISANVYWAAAEGAHSRANARTALMVEFALPSGLSRGAQNTLAMRMAEAVSRLGMDGTPLSHRLPVTFAIHEGGGSNPHVHMLVSTSINDQVARPREQWFRRFQSKARERGGAPRHRHLTKKGWVRQVRALWARLANEVLVAMGLPATLDHRSFAERGIVKAPTIHLGPRLAGLAARGELTPRISRSNKVVEENEALEALEDEIARRNKAVRELEWQSRLLVHAREVWKAMSDSTVAAILSEHPLGGGAPDVRSAATAVIVEADATNAPLLRDAYEKLLTEDLVASIAGEAWDVVKPQQGIWLVRPAADTVVMLGPGYAATDAVDEDAITAMLRMARRLPFKKPVVLARDLLFETVRGLMEAMEMDWPSRKLIAGRKKKLQL